MYFIYNCIFFVYALFYLPYLTLTRRGFKGFEMRFGLFNASIQKQIKAHANIWLHAVSVGEVTALGQFIDLLAQRYPDYQIIVTVTTKTGYLLACERLKGKALVIPSPIDFDFVVRRFVSLINPKMYIAVETEIWPNLYRRLFLKGIPLAVINGRISDNSFGRYKRVRFFLKSVLNQVSLWCMQSPQDAQRIIELGADSNRVVMTGNIKFDDVPQSPDILNKPNNHEDRLWWVAGSTHPGEEEIVLDVYSKIIKNNPKWRLVIAPRHVERAPQIKGLITCRGLKDVVVIDTIGQLRSLYAKASLVFVGKSLCVGGGQNIIEPAFYGKAIVIGPKVENFRDIVACFKEKNAIVQVEDAHAFEIAVRVLCADASKREILGAAAREVIAANQGATQRCLECLKRFRLSPE
jgi:3-deoxy-D-manno-octulosonic-acid transferase